jgi:hypothetical protein
MRRGFCLSDCLELARSGRSRMSAQAPLSGANGQHLLTTSIAAHDPIRTLTSLYGRCTGQCSLHPLNRDASSLRIASRGIATPPDQLSLEQSRGVMRFSAAYFAAISLTIGSVTVSSAVYQSEITFQATPSHC